MRKEKREKGENMETAKKFNMLKQKHNLVMSFMLNNKQLLEGKQKEDLLKAWDGFNRYLIDLTLEHPNNEQLELINNHVANITTYSTFVGVKGAFLDLSKEIDRLRVR